MDETTRTNLENLWSQDRAVQNAAFNEVMAATAVSVAWAYEVWDKLVLGMRHKDNHVRAISAQVLCNLAKSDPEYRMLNDFDKLLTLTKDERFVTARHCLQAIWKVGAAGKPQQKILVEGLNGRFQECLAEKNCTLIRYDIIQGLRNLYDEVGDEAIKEKSWALIETKDDLKYRKKYAAIWKSS